MKLSLLIPSNHEAAQPGGLLMGKVFVVDNVVQVAVESLVNHAFEGYVTLYGLSPLITIHPYNNIYRSFDHKGNADEFVRQFAEALELARDHQKEVEKWVAKEIHFWAEQLVEDPSGYIEP